MNQGQGRRQVFTALLSGCSSGGRGAGAFPPGQLDSRSSTGRYSLVRCSVLQQRYSRGDLVADLKPPCPSQVFPGHKYSSVALRGRVVRTGSSRADRTSLAAGCGGSALRSFGLTSRIIRSWYVVIRTSSVTVPLRHCSRSQHSGVTGCSVVHHPLPTESSSRFKPVNKKSSGKEPKRALDSLPCFKAAFAAGAGFSGNRLRLAG